MTPSNGVASKPRKLLSSVTLESELAKIAGNHTPEERRILAKTLARWARQLRKTAAIIERQAHSAAVWLDHKQAILN